MAVNAVVLRIGQQGARATGRQISYVRKEIVRLQLAAQASQVQIRAHQAALAKPVLPPRDPRGRFMKAPLGWAETQRAGIKERLQTEMAAMETLKVGLSKTRSVFRKMTTQMPAAARSWTGFFKKVTPRIRSFTSALAQSTAGIRIWRTMLLIGITAGALKAAMAVTKLGGVIGATKQLFEGTAKAAGTVSDAFLTKLRKATMGTISDFQMMQTANYAAIAGLTTTGDEFAKLAEAAVKLGVALGRDTADSMQRLINTITKAERRVVDEIGLIVNYADAYREFGKQIGKSSSQLTAQEKLLARQRLVVEMVTKKLEYFNNVNMEMATAGHRVQAEMENLKNKFAEIFFESGAASRILRIFSDALKRIDDLLQDVGAREAIFKGIEIAVRTILRFMTLILNIIAKLEPYLDAIFVMIQYKIGAAIGRLLGGDIANFISKLLAFIPGVGKHIGGLVEEIPGIIGGVGAVAAGTGGGGGGGELSSASNAVDQLSRDANVVRRHINNMEIASPANAVPLIA